MMNLFRTRKVATTLKVVYKWVDSDELITANCSSGGLASLLADPCVVVVEVR